MHLHYAFYITHHTHETTQPNQLKYICISHYISLVPSSPIHIIIPHSTYTHYKTCFFSLHKIKLFSFSLLLLLQQHDILLQNCKWLLKLIKITTQSSLCAEHKYKYYYYNVCKKNTVIIMITSHPPRPPHHRHHHPHQNKKVLW